MSFGTPKIDTPKLPANIDANSLNTNQQAIPVTCFGGRRRIPLLWHTPAYNQVSEPITTKAGKGSDSQTTGYNYYVDLAGLISLCSGRTPISKLFRYIVNSEIAWENTGGLARGSDSSTAIMVTNYGQTWIYWGLEDQPIDTHVLTPIGPPPSPTDDPGFNPRDPSTWPNYDQTGQHPEP